MLLGPLAALLLSGVSPLPIHHASYSGDAPPTTQADSRPDENEKRFTDFFVQIEEKRFQDALKTVGKIDVGEENPQGEAIIAVMRGSALLGLQRDSEAKRYFELADKLAQQVSAIDNLGFDTTLIVGNFNWATIYFDRLITSAPELVREMHPARLGYLLRNEPKDQIERNDDRRVALARLGYGGEEGDYFAGQAVEILVKRGDVAGANEILAYIDDPQTVERLLIQRHMSSVWPRLESIAGPGLERVRATSAGTAERAFAAAPGDHEKLQMLINALRHSGRQDEAIGLRSKLPATPEAMAEANEDIGWAVNNVALALSEVGRGDDADALFAMLNDAPMEDARWRVSMNINRLELLVSEGRFEKALPLLDFTEKSAANDGNPYSQQLVRRLRFCTMSGLGRKEEAARLLPEMLKHAEDAAGPTIDGLICAGELDQAERLALESLKKPQFEAEFVHSLQARPLTSDDLSVWDKGWKELRLRPAIAREFERLGRDMPEHLVPPRPIKLGDQAEK